MDEERLRAIYPSLDDKELKEASDNLRAYFAVALRVVLGTRVDKENGPNTMKERSKGSLKNTSFEHG